MSFGWEFQFGLQFAVYSCRIKDFKVFQLSKTYYQQCKLLKLPHFLKDQLLRASSSVALNIAEGSGKRTQKDQSRFYGIALGSLRESQAILEIEDIDNKHLKELSDQIGAILFKLSKKQTTEKRN